MSETLDKISALVEEVQSLRDKVKSETRDEEVDRLRAETVRAKYSESEAIKARDQAVKELASVKAAIAWTMSDLRISDYFGNGSENIPCAADGWLPFSNDFQDSPRMDWINKHGRIGVGQQNQFVLALPSKIPIVDQEIPTVYNIRHLIDICRKNNP